MYAALRDNTYRDLPPDARDRVRASVFKQMLLATMQ